jgi:hypothetical protein
LQALSLAVLLRCWSVSTGATRAYLVCYTSAAAAALAWQRVGTASYARWLEVPAALLALFSLGLGQGWLQVRRLIAADAALPLDSLSAAEPDASPAGAFAATASHALLLLFASGTVGMAALTFNLRMRIR